MKLLVILFTILLLIGGAFAVSQKPGWGDINTSQTFPNNLAMGGYDITGVDDMNATAVYSGGELQRNQTLGYDAIITADGAYFSNGSLIIRSGDDFTNFNTTASVFAGYANPSFLFTNHEFIWNDEYVITKPITIVGVPGSRILQITAGKSIFTSLPSFGINGVYIQSLSLGGVSGTLHCLNLTAILRSTFRDINIYGCGAAGINLIGSGANIFDNVKVIRYGNFNASVVAAPIGISLSSLSVPAAYASNANVFVNPIIESCNIGIQIGSGVIGLSVLGGVIQNISDYGIDATSAASIRVIGTHLEVAPVRFIQCQDVSYYPSFSDDVDIVGTKRLEGGKSTWGDCHIFSNSSDTLLNGVVFCGWLVDNSNSSLISNCPVLSNGNKIVGTKNVKTKTIYSMPDVWSSGVPVGIVKYGTSTITQCGVGLSDTTNLFGLYCMNVSKSLAPNDYRGIQFHVDPKIGEWVTIDCWIKPQTGTIRILALYDAGVSVENEEVVSTSTDWQHVVRSFRMIEGYSSMDIVISSGYVESNSTFYVDRAEVLINEYSSSSIASTGARLLLTGTSQAVAHGLAIAPTNQSINVVKESEGTDWWFSAPPSETNFYINGTAGKYVDWSIN